MRSLLSACVLAMVVASAANARGAGAQEADAVFGEAKAAEKQGDLVRACDLFKKSYDLEPAAGTLVNLARCEGELGRLEKSADLWRAALGALPKNDPRRVHALEQLEILGARMTRIVVRLEASDGPDATVEVDGRKLTREERAVPFTVTAGRHRVRVEGPGGTAREVQVDVLRGETKEVTLGAVGLPSSPAPPAAASSSPGHGRRTLALAAGGLGVAASLAAGVTGVIIINASATADSECRNGCSEAGRDAIEQGRGLLVVNAVAFGVGAVGIAVGTYLLLSAPATPDGSRSMGSRGAAPRGWSFDPLRLRGTF